MFVRHFYIEFLSVKLFLMTFWLFRLFRSVSGLITWESLEVNRYINQEGGEPHYIYTMIMLSPNHPIVIS